MKNRMLEQSSDNTVQDDPLMRLANQSCIDEVTGLLRRTGFVQAIVGRDERHGASNTPPSHHVVS